MYVVCTAEHAVVAGPVTVPTFGQHWLLSRLPLSVISALQHCYTAVQFFVFFVLGTRLVIAQCMHNACWKCQA